MTFAELTVIAALGASALTGLASLGLVAFQEWRRGKASDQDALRAAIGELLARSLALTLRAEVIAAALKNRSGLREFLDVMMHHRKPVDMLEVHDWMAQDWAPLNTALSDLWTRCDQEGMRLANDVVGRCGDLLRISVALQPARTRTERVQRWAAGERWTPELLADFQYAVKEHAQARKRFANYARAKLGQQSTDLLFAQADLTSESRQQRV